MISPPRFQGKLRTVLARTILESPGGRTDLADRASRTVSRADTDEDGPMTAIWQLLRLRRRAQPT
jgi:hypothetical protein